MINEIGAAEMQEQELNLHGIDIRSETSFNSDDSSIEGKDDYSDSVSYRVDDEDRPENVQSNQKPQT